MKAGILRHRLKLQERGFISQDPTTGELIYGWVDIADVWGRVEPLSARDFIAASAVQSEVSARITIRYRTDVTPTTRILHRDRIYNITGVLADNRSGLEYLTLPVKEGVNQG